MSEYILRYFFYLMKLTMEKKTRLLYRRQFLPIIRYFSAMSTGSQNLSDRPKGVSEWNCDGGKKNNEAEKKN